MISPHKPWLNDTPSNTVIDTQVGYTVTSHSATLQRYTNLVYSVNHAIMISFWQGSLHHIFWPYHTKQFHDLPTELWFPDSFEGKIPFSLPNTSQLEFSGYLSVCAVPLYQICGPELEVTANDPVSRQFFAEFTQISSAVIQLKIKNADSKLGFDGILIFPTETESNSRIRARLLRSDLHIRMLPPTKLLHSSPLDHITEPDNGKPGTIKQLNDTESESKANYPIANQSRRVDLLGNTKFPQELLTRKFSEVVKKATEEYLPGAISSSLECAPARRPPDVKKTIQHTIMAGLRLRGFRSAHQNFKRLYFSILNLVEIATEQMDPQDVTTTYIHNTVEAILVAIEPTNSQ